MIPNWLLDVVAGVLLAVAALSAARLAAARPWRQGSVVIDTDVAHLLMAIAMAGVFTPGLAILPDTAWEVLFSLMTAWFAVRVLLDTRASGGRALAAGHCAPYLVHSAAMLYMFAALTAPAAGMSGMGGMSGGSVSMIALRTPTLGFLFALVLASYSVWDLDQLSGQQMVRVALAGGGEVGVPALAGTGPRSALRGARAADRAAGSVPSPLPAADRDVRRVSRHGAGEFLLSPAVTVGCRITIGIAMVFLLVISI